MAGVNDRAGAEEKKRLEPGVGEEVEHARLAGNEAHGHDHVAKLGEGRVGEYALDVVLLGGHERGDQCGEAAGPGDDGAGLQTFEDFETKRELQAEEHVNSGGNHGRGVDERGDGSGAFHGVRKPDVERELRGFPNSPAENTEHRGG